MKRLFFAILLLLVAVPVAYAQEELQPGTVVVGELTADVYEVNYTFSGKEGEVVVIEADPVDALGDLDDTILILKDADGVVVADTTDAFSFGSSLLAAQLPSTGTYNLTVTREDGADGASVGEFELVVNRPAYLGVDNPVSNTISSEGRKQYYVVASEVPFTLNYAKSGGDFFPDVLVSTMDPDDGSLDQVAQLSGDMFSVGSMGYFEGQVLYVATVRERFFDFNFTEVTADYTMSITPAE